MIPVRLIVDSCREYKAWHEYCLDPSESAVLTLYGHGDAYDLMRPTARNRLRHSCRLGYYSRELTWPERTNYLDDIHQVNISMPVRQKKDIAEHYKEYPKEITGGKICDNHYGTFIGCFGTRPGTEDDARLVAYITTNFCGEIAAASQILGHGSYLQDGIMLNLWAEFVKVCIDRGIKHIVYSRWNDGWDGLRHWKQSVGMKPATLCEVAH